MKRLLLIFALWLSLCGAAQGITNSGSRASLHLQFLGDTYLPRHVLRRTGSQLEDPRLFAGLRAVLDASEVNVVNFEGVATRSFVPLTMKKYLLNMPDVVPAMLRRVGVDVALLANNHTMDYGFQGLFDTLAGLHQAGIAAGGAGTNLDEALRPVIIGAGGRSVCLLAFSRTLPADFWAKESRPGTAYVDFERTAQVIRRCREAGHFTVANFHWGQELSARPKKYQKQLARLAIRAGADCVIGHHPHVLQSVEVYRGKPIFYSLGNFYFGTQPLGTHQEGLAVGLKFSEVGQSVVYELRPLQVANKLVRFVPRQLRVDERDPLQALLPRGFCRKKIVKQIVGGSGESRKPSAGVQRSSQQQHQYVHYSCRASTTY